MNGDSEIVYISISKKYFKFYWIIFNFYRIMIDINICMWVY